MLRRATSQTVPSNAGVAQMPNCFRVHRRYGAWKEYLEADYEWAGARITGMAFPTYESAKGAAVYMATLEEHDKRMQIGITWGPL